MCSLQNVTEEVSMFMGIYIDIYSSFFDIFDIHSMYIDTSLLKVRMMHMYVRMYFYRMCSL